MQLANWDADKLTVAVVADLHINSTMALMPPNTYLDDGQPVGQSPFQQKLWSCWRDFWGQVEREKGDGELVTILDGDIVDGDHHHTPQIISTNLETQERMALDVLEQPARLSNAIFVVRGTEVHSGLAGQQEEAIARQLHAVKPDLWSYSWYSLRAEFGGVKFDVAHHGPLGRLPWTKANMVNRLAVEVEIEYHRLGQTPPDFALRAHNHQFADSGLNFRCMQFPCPAGRGRRPMCTGSSRGRCRTSAG